MRKIALIGTHGTGKTTLAHELVAKSKKLGINTEFLGEIARVCPLPINENQIRESGEWMIFEQNAKELEHTGKCDLLIEDRSIFDPYVYHFRKFGEDRFLRGVVVEKSRKYASLIKVPINKKWLVNDNVRSTDKDFQIEVDELFTQLLRELDIPYVNYESKEQVIGIVKGLYGIK